MSLPRYPEYKASGVEWLGEVPGHWETWKLSHAFGSIGSGTTPPSNESQWYEDGLVPWVTTGELRENVIFETAKSITAAALEKFTALRVHPAGSLVVAMYGATIGRLGVLGVDATTNQACCVLSSPLILDTRFVYFWLDGFKQTIINLYATGGGQPNISQDTIASLRIPAPHIEEQQTIAAFLDRETGKIDALIAEQRRLVELLAEKRQAVISHAVTKGLNPIRHSGESRNPAEKTVPRSGQSDCPAAQEFSNDLDSGFRRNDGVVMKDSGIEWLGEVPEHWVVVPLGHLATQIQTGPFGSQLHSEEYVDGETPVINPSNIQDGKLIADWSCTVTQEVVDRLSHHKLSYGDIVFGRRGEMGRCALVTMNEVNWLCGTGSLNVRLSSRANPEFISIYLRTSYVRELLKLESVGSTMDNLNTEILSGVLIPCPSPEEQKSIAAFLDRETAKFDTLTAEANRAIALLQERRSALISAAVTGKIDVRGVVIPAQAGIQQDYVSA